MSNRPTLANLSMITYVTKCLDNLSIEECQELIVEVRLAFDVWLSVLRSDLQQRRGHMRATELAEAACDQADAQLEFELGD